MSERKLPQIYVEEFFFRRRRLVENMLKKPLEELEIEIAVNAPLLSPIVATCGPAGPNAAPFMLSFTVKDEYIKEAITEMKKIAEKYYGSREAYRAAASFLLDYVYNMERANLLRLITHLMSKGHTYQNIMATKEATISILFPPDRGALELRTTAYIVEKGDLYIYANMLHDLMHVVPRGKREHPWYPAIVFEVKEIYDNSYQALGKRIYP